MSFRHWNLGPFADWLRGTPYPQSASCEEWDRIRKEAQAAHPFRYWLVEEFVDKLQDVVCWPAKKVHDAKRYFRNRFINKTHLIKTGLEPGHWYESEDQILHGMFGVLVEFIEVENAWMFAICNDDIKLPWFWQRFRRPDLGMLRLEWEISLVDEVGNPTHQSVSATEQKALYLWWTQERPARQDPVDLIKGNPHSMSDNLSYEEKYGDMNALERQHEEEDTEMLCRLIKIRSNLWT